MTTRSRFAAVLGLAGLTVAGVQLATMSTPPTVVQVVVVVFWALVGGAYLASASGQRLRERIRPRHHLARGARTLQRRVGELVGRPGRGPVPRRPPGASRPVDPRTAFVPIPVRPARPRPGTGGGAAPVPGSEDDTAVLAAPEETTDVHTVVVTPLPSRAASEPTPAAMARTTLSFGRVTGPATLAPGRPAPVAPAAAGPAPAGGTRRGGGHRRPDPDVVPMPAPRTHDSGRHASPLPVVGRSGRNGHR